MVGMFWRLLGGDRGCEGGSGEGGLECFENCSSMGNV